MTWVVTAIVGSQVVGGLIGSSAATSAADTQAQSAANAQQISQNEFNTITAQQQPFIQSGYGSLGQLNYLLGNGAPPQNVPLSSGPQILSSQAFDPQIGSLSGLPFITGEFNVGNAGMANASSPSAPLSGAWWGKPSAISPLSSITGTQSGGYTPGSGIPSGSMPVASGSTGGGYGSLLAPFTADTFRQYSPAYNFQLQQGRQGVLNADASSQGDLSGAALKDLISYNQNYANTAFGNAFNQYQTQQGNIYSRLAGIAQLGQAGAANTGQQGTALAGQAAQSATNIGTAQAAGQIGAANAWSGAVGNLSSLPWLLQGSGGGALGAAESSGFLG